MNARPTLSSSFSGPFGRVPNFSTQYLNSLNSADSSFGEQQAQQQQQQRQQQRQQQPLPVVRQQVSLNGQQQQQQQQSLAPTRRATVDVPREQYMSNATIVSNTVSSTSVTTMAPPPPGVPAASIRPPQVVITSSKGGSPKISSSADRRHPTSIVLSPLQGGPMVPPPYPVPEFLCHLYSMLIDPALNDLISWVVPATDETADFGGGKAGIGKIIVHDPTRLQDEVLGKYYRHSKYSSFQRQLNYFGFKKRLHGCKKGKMCPCSFVHSTLGTDPQSLLNLKRRPPTGKRVKSEPNLVQQKDMADKKKRPKKYKKRGSMDASISCDISMASSPYPIGLKFSTNNNNNGAMSCTKNATWDVNNNQSVAAPGALNTPFMTQAVAAFPNQLLPQGAWQQATQINIQAPAITTSSFQNVINPNGPKNDIPSLQDANNAAVLQARKSLEQNFLKSQQERNGVSSMPGENTISIQHRTASVQRSNTVIQQQQQMMMLVQPNQFPNQFPGTMNNKDGRLPTQPVAPASESWATAGKEWMGQAAPANNAAFSTNYNPQANFPGMMFPSKAPINVNNSGPLSAVASAPSTNNNPMALHSNNNNNNIMPSVMMTRFESHPQGITETPPVHQFKDLFSNLLSTSLPPSDELFDDDMSAGNISDWGSGALQVADDGMLLP